MTYEPSWKRSAVFGAGAGLLFGGMFYYAALELDKWDMNPLTYGALFGGIVIPVHYIIDRFVFPYVWPVRRKHASLDVYKKD